MRPRIAHAAALISLVAIPLCSVAPAFAQRGGGFRGMSQEPATQNIPYDGRFSLARLKFTTNSPAGYYYRGLPAWAHGYPDAEQNLMKIVKELTTGRPSIGRSNVFALDDPQLFKFPVAYMAEPDYWGMTDKEAAALRAYLLKGGFLIFDDFRDDFRDGYRGWANFEEQIQRVLPAARFVDMDTKHPIFHSFYEISTFDIVPQFYDRSRPVFRGLYEDNDPKKRLMMIVNFNTDVSNYWEFSATGWRPLSESNEAYKLGVNYVIYALTH